MKFFRQSASLVGLYSVAYKKWSKVFYGLKFPLCQGLDKTSNNLKITKYWTFDLDQKVEKWKAWRLRIIYSNSLNPLHLLTFIWVEREINRDRQRKAFPPLVHPASTCSSRGWSRTKAKSQVPWCIQGILLLKPSSVAWQCVHELKAETESGAFTLTYALLCGSLKRCVNTYT